MVRRRILIEEKEEFYEWPFETNIKIKISKPKIAFLSGCPRDCYKDDPGFGKNPDNTVKCNFYPRIDNHLNKPISKLGYGVGGLSASPRFPLDFSLQTPAPNAYHQHMLFPQRATKVQKVPQVSLKEFAEKYEQLAEVSQEINNRPTVGAKRDVSYCPSAKTVAFGRALHKSRFDENNSSDTPGTGTYNPNHPPTRSFQITTPQGALLPHVRLNCIPRGWDTCMSCKINLYKSDYYQTRQKFKVKNALDKVDLANHKYKMTYLSFCRDCYCHAVTYGYETWTKEEIPKLFTKARHCNMVHDHEQGQSEYLTRVTSKGMLQLARKELLFSRYFKDNPCRKEISNQNT